jgi:hypothetical protein
MSQHCCYLTRQVHLVQTLNGIKTVGATLTIMLQAAIMMVVTAATVPALSITHHQIILVE